MPIDQLALIVAVVSFVVALIGPVTTALIAFFQNRADRTEARNKLRREHWRGILQELVRLRSEIRHGQSVSDNARDTTRADEDLEGFEAEATGLLLTINNIEVQKIVQSVLDGSMIINMTTDNRTAIVIAIDEAIRYIGKLIDESW